MKTCFKCNESKPLDSFYRHPRMRDGRLGKCIPCARQDVTENRARRREQYAEYERERFRRPERKAQLRETVKRRRERSPEKDRARRAVGNAIRAGRIIRPANCEHCGEAVKVQAHHTDYAKPLDVEWLCFRCHREHGHGQVVIAGT